ncbi:hypothetical protein JYU34_013633 [Plutella xylostella]|uniref:Uncharacterized protein n=2 Tax=Plutella xylostella TaxID=51655 RepID=A0ABQ7QA86_PLUXY|nr:hypothetical protein JYU34_013633 [Plutella xylostella]CAG9135882.1 unnamed protein product [Plutella xylostella]
MGSPVLVVFLTGTVLAILHSTNALSDDNKEKIKQDMVPIVMECAKEQEINPEDLKELKGAKTLPEDKDMMMPCFFACTFQKNGMMDDNGMFLPEATIKNGKKYAENEEEEKKMEEIAKACAPVNDESVSGDKQKCQRASLLYACLAEQAEKHNIKMHE